MQENEDEFWGWVRQMTKLILTRHGHVEGIEPELFRGRTDVPLTELGRIQAKAVASRIAALWTPVAIYSSPMGRCVSTADAIAEACHVERHVLDELNDLDYGQWQWQTYDAVRRTWPDQFAAWQSKPHLVRFPDGDSLQDLVARTANALRFVISRHKSSTETVVLVGHDSVNRALLLQLLDQPLAAYWRLAQAPCALNEIDIVDGNIRVQRINETSHLAGIA
jgi:probable phosphoglycerate mutase